LTSCRYRFLSSSSFDLVHSTADVAFHGSALGASISAAFSL
jgi:hypothetical protein